MKLSPEQRQAIQAHIPGFKKYLEGEDAKQVIAEVDERTKLFKNLLREEKVSLLTEDDFASVLMKLWALNFWRNKEFKIRQVLQDNGIAVIREELKHLLYGNNPIDARYDHFRKNVKGLGPAMITEILITMFPDRYCLWNEKPRNILPYLKMNRLLPESVFKGELKGIDYVNCVEVMKLIRDELKRNGIVGVGSEVTPGFRTTDLFMWYLWGTKREEIALTSQESKIIEGGVVTPSVEIDSHEKVEAIILTLGGMLGYDTFTADAGKEVEADIYSIEGKPAQARTKAIITLGQLASLKEVPGFAPDRILESVKKIDVIWFKEEFPEVCFEVEHTTNIKDGLLRQYQISKHVPNAKFFVIGPEWQGEKFEKEVGTYPFTQIRQRYRFKSYKELIEFYLEATRYSELKSKFGL